MKRCSVCKQDKSLEQFNKNKARKDGLQSACRDCSHKRFKAYWDTNGDKHRATVKERTLKVIAECQEFVADYLYTNPCVDCGNTDIRVLEFDHVRGEKRSGVGRLVAGGYGLRAVKNEIAKCEVRCKNCHTIITYERMGGTWHDKWVVEHGG